MDALYRHAKPRDLVTPAVTYCPIPTASLGNLHYEPQSLPPNHIAAPCPSTLIVSLCLTVHSIAVPPPWGSFPPFYYNTISHSRNRLLAVHIISRHSATDPEIGLASLLPPRDSFGDSF